MQHRSGVAGDRIDDLLGLGASALERLASADLSFGLDRLRLRAGQALVVLGACRDALGVLERCRDLLVRVVGDPLRVSDGLVVQHEELLLRVVLAAGEGLLELQHTGVHVAHIALGIGTQLGRLTGDERAQRGRALLSFGTDRRGLLCGLVHLLRGVRGFALDACLVRRVLGVHLQAHLIGVTLRLGGDPLGVGLGLSALRGHFLTGRGHQTVGLHGRVLDEHVRLLLGDPQDRLELLARRSLFAVRLRSVDEFGGEGGDLLLGVGHLRVRGRQLALESFASLALFFPHRLDGFLFAGLGLGDLCGGLLELVAESRERRVDLGLVVAAEADGERTLLLAGRGLDQLVEEVRRALAVAVGGTGRFAHGFLAFLAGPHRERRLHPDSRDGVDRRRSSGRTPPP